MSGISIHAVCDTNVVIYLLSGDVAIAKLLHGMDAKISVISELELLSKPNITQAEITKTKAFIEQCSIIDLAPPIKRKVVEIRRKTKIKLPDAIIAASAITLGLPLITADKQFEKIEELDVILINRETN